MKKKIISFCLIFSLIFLTAPSISPVQAATMNQYKWVNIKQVEITAYVLNVRTGPSTAYPVINKVRRGDKINVMGALGSWYVVHLPNNSVGCISSTWTRVHSYVNQPENKPSEKPTMEDTKGLTAEEKEMFDLVNKARAQQGLPAYKINMEVVKVARIKAKDMSDKKYFSHDSPTYGSPFDMLKQFGVKYSRAGENIAGNNSVINAHNALMNSPGHRANILNSNFTEIGIGIVDDPRYGLVFVQMFVTP